LFISGQVARPLRGREDAGRQKPEYEQAKHIFSRIQRICEAAGGSNGGHRQDDHLPRRHQEEHRGVAGAARVLHRRLPASTLVEVRSLAGPETLVEIETVAYLGKK
jgi:enamine deaminase RidA (YjgF/YER057c/UK114 family)